MLIAGSAVGQASNIQKVSPELAGEWCYIRSSASTLESISRSCITLYADGTYEMRLDRSVMSGTESSLPGISDNDAGTWWVDNDIFHYKSDNHGEGSFRFQKANHPRIEMTPVLIIAGAIFCSPTPRDPW